MKKKVFFIILVGILFINLVSAINLDVNAKQISNTYIIELNEPAVFDLTIRNLEKNNTFEIYSLVGVDIEPSAPFNIASGQTKTIRIKITPQESLKARKGFFNFQYKIKDSENQIQEESLTINIINLEDAFLITPQNINPQSEEAIITIKNKASINFSDIDAKFTSAFFDEEVSFPLNALETKEIPININKEKLKILNAGSYLFNTQIKTNGKTVNIESMIKFLEQEDIETTEIKEGWIVRRDEIIKKNVGNVRKTVKITTEKNLVSYLFTTSNINPIETKTIGFQKQYTWEKELIPNDELRIIVKTNWYFPIIIIILIIIITIFIRKSIETDLMLRKKVSFVKTKGGQFALKVSLRVKAKKFIERVRVIDKLPHLVKLYERFGAVTPDKIDLKNKRIEWNVESLNKDEERIFSYIIYSRIGVVGRFELPSATATYEKEGKIKEAISNRSFFINEPQSESE